MSLDNLSPEKEDLVMQKYSELGFCYETRLHLAPFIETNFNLGGVDDGIAINIASQLLIELRTYISNLDNQPQTRTSKRTLQSTYENLMGNSSNDDLIRLYSQVVQCLEQERSIIEEVSTVQNQDEQDSVPMISGDEADCSTEMSESSNTQNKINISILKGETAKARKDIDKIQQKEEVYRTDIQSVSNYQNQYVQNKAQHAEETPRMRKMKTDLMALQRALTSKKNILENSKIQVSNDLEGIYERSKKVLDLVVDLELMQWKKNQRTDDDNDSDKLKLIQEWCEGLAEIFWNMQQLVKQLVEITNDKTRLEDLRSKIIKALQYLVSCSLIIEQQPSQVVRTSSNRFTSKVKLLVGCFLCERDTLQVNVTILPLEQLCELPTTASCAEITNCKKTMMYNRGKEEFSADFNNLMLRNIKRGRRSGDSVTHGLYSIIFSTEFSKDGIKFQLCVPSVPVVVIAHDNQKVKALATVTWANSRDEPMVEQEYIKVGQIIETLSITMNKACGRPLSEEMKYYLACKALRCQELDPNNYKENCLSWSQFNKECLPGQKWTFWEWFHSMLNLTQHHLDILWKHDCVVGFVTRQAACAMLQNQPKGTFLLRFSESKLGGVAITYQAADPTLGNSNVTSLEPFSKEELGKSGIFHAFYDLGRLTQLHPSHHGPNIPKAFFEQYKKSIEENSPQDGYVQRILMWVSLDPQMPNANLNGPFNGNDAMETDDTDLTAFINNIISDGTLPDLDFDETLLLSPQHSVSSTESS